MHRVTWAAIMYAIAVCLLVLASGKVFTDPQSGKIKAFGLLEGQSPLALSVALPCVGIATYAVATLIDLVTV